MSSFSLRNVADKAVAAAPKATVYALAGFAGVAVLAGAYRAFGHLSAANKYVNKALYMPKMAGQFSAKLVKNLSDKQLIAAGVTSGVAALVIDRAISFRDFNPAGMV